MQAEDDNWMPLESNPEVINKYVQDLGFDTSTYQLSDVLSVDDWAQDMVPKPVKAVIFLYPINEAQEAFRKKQAETIKKDGQKLSENLFFMEQHADNACGTVAMLHSIVNLSKSSPSLVSKDSFIAKFIEETKSLNANERGKYLKGNKTLEGHHKKAVDKGDTKAEATVNTHFIAFVEFEGNLYELDGRKDTPINHGECKADELLAKSCEAIKVFMARDPEEIKFTIMALAAPPLDM